MIEPSDEAIADAENAEEVILHYSNDEKLVLIEILDFCRFMSDKTVAELLAS